MDEVMDGLWVSDISAVREESTDRFDAVVTVCQDRVDDNVGCEYHFFNMSDGPDNSYGGDSSFMLFQRAAETVETLLDAGKETLVHCHMGRSRSVSVCIAAVGAHSGCSFEEARDIVFDARPQAAPDERLLDHAKLYV